MTFSASASAAAPNGRAQHEIYEEFWRSTGCEAVLFDMDGTLVDNMGFHHQAWLEWSRREGLPHSEEELLLLTHGTIGEIVRRLFPEETQPEVLFAIGERKEAIYREFYAPHLALLPGCAPWLQWLHARAVPLAVATAGDRTNMAFTIDGLGVRDYFGAIITGEDVQRGKPHPEVFLLAAAQLGIAPEKCLVFEDSLPGVEAAHRAGMPCVVVNPMTPRENFGDTSHVLRFLPDYQGLG